MLRCFVLTLRDCTDLIFKRWGRETRREIKLVGNLVPILQMAGSLRALAFGGATTRLTAGFADGQNATRPSRRSSEGLKAGDLDCRCRWLRGRATSGTCSCGAWWPDPCENRRRHSAKGRWNPSRSSARHAIRCRGFPFRSVTRDSGVSAIAPLARTHAQGPGPSFHRTVDLRSAGRPAIPIA
jgi:hypothetical protein